MAEVATIARPYAEAGEILVYFFALLDELVGQPVGHGPMLVDFALIGL